MKYSECTMRQKKAWRNVKYAAGDYIGGLENGCLDSPKDSSDYRDYLSALRDLEGLIETVYDAAITNVYDEGSCCFGKDAELFIKDIRFCGKDFIMRVVSHYCTKFQAEALSAIGEEPVQAAGGNNYIPTPDKPTKSRGEAR